MKSFALPLLAIAAVAGVTLSFSSRASAQEQQTKTVSQFPNLVEGLKQTPGCLGVETVTAKGGKQFVIMAWFENKKAVAAWYSSPTHQQAMAKFFPGFHSNHAPLSGIKDETAPIMVIASVTPSTKPIEGQQLAVSQIAIEMYTPMAGGLALGSSFAPESLNVPGLMRIKTH